MAQVFSTGFAPVAPVTPIKAGANVQTTEVSPDSTPAPKYSTASYYPPGMVGIASYGKEYTTEEPSLESTGYGKKHPVLPIGNLFNDIRNHLSCHSIFNANIDRLLEEYSIMKRDLESARSEVAKLEREVKKERREKQDYKNEAQELKKALMESEDTLAGTRAELLVTQEKLRLSVQQLMDVTKRLEEAKTQLRNALNERDQLARVVEIKEAELQYCKKRIDELVCALALANKGEDDANDRNVRLTQLLYQIERQKAEIERARDAAEKRLREVEDDPERGSERLKKVIAELRQCLVQLELQIVTLEIQRDDAQKTIGVRDHTITELNHEIAQATFTKISYQEIVGRYEDVVNNLRKGKGRFRKLRRSRAQTLGPDEESMLKEYLRTRKIPVEIMSVEDSDEDDNDDTVGTYDENDKTKNSANEPVQPPVEPAKGPAVEPEPEKKVEEVAAPTEDKPAAAEEPIAKTPETAEPTETPAGEAAKLQV